MQVFYRAKIWDSNWNRKNGIKQNAKRREDREKPEGFI